MAMTCRILLAALTLGPIAACAPGGGPGRTSATFSGSDATATLAQAANTLREGRCRGSGAGHALVEFGRDGRVLSVKVSQVQSSDVDAACVEAVFHECRVAPFKGEARSVIAGKWFRFATACAGCVDPVTTDFDRKAAAASLFAAAEQAGRCLDSGWGHAKITFMPDGAVSTVDVDDSPGASGPQRGCISNAFHQAKAITAFEGPPVAVGKTCHAP